MDTGMAQKVLTIGSLFAGIGGLELGLERASNDRLQFKTSWQVEIDDYATAVLAKHWPDVRRWRDVTTFPPDADGTGCTPRERDGIRKSTRQSVRTDTPTRCGNTWYADIITGGFPCQDISYAGAGAGLDGERSGLWYEYARIVRTLRPRWVLVENVAALLTRGIDAVLGTLASIGYDAEWHCIPAASVGAPHIRDRVFVLAHTKQNGSGPRRAKRKGLKREPAPIHAGGDVPHALRPICQQRPGGRGVREGDTELADTISKHDDDGGPRAGPICGKRPEPSRLQRSQQWLVEPAVGQLVDGVSSDLVRFAGRTATGVPNRVAKLRCLGNAVVPQVAQYIGERIREAELKQ